MPPIRFGMKNTVRKALVPRMALVRIRATARPPMLMASVLTTTKAQLYQKAWVKVVSRRALMKLEMPMKVASRTVSIFIRGEKRVERAIRKYWPIFVLPTLLAFVFGFIIPFAEGVYLAFCQFTTVKDATFIGLSNFTKVFADSTFTHAFWYNCAFVVVSTLVINVGGLAVALILTKAIRGTNAFRTVFFMPNLIGGIVLGYIWQILLNCALSLLEQPLLRLDATAGFWGLVILMAWQQIGYMMIIYIAGLQSIPDTLVEAAEIDGATPWQTFWKVKLPMLMPSITICLFLTITNSFKLFDQNLALTGGEPNHASELLAYNIYYTFYGRSGPQWRGIGQAKAVVFCLIVVAISLIQLRSTRRKEVQQ